MMPLYDFKCEAGHKFEKMVPLSDFYLPVHCSCQAPASRIISTPMFSVDHTDYSCPVTGSSIRSRYQHEENLKRHDCRVLEPGEREGAERARASSNDALDEKIASSAEKIVEEMPSEKKERLYNEITRGGADVSYQRGVVT